MAEGFRISRDFAEQTVRTIKRVGDFPIGHDHTFIQTRFEDGGIAVSPRLRLGKTIGEINKESAGDVALYDNASNDCRGTCVPFEFPSAGETVCAQNLIQKVPAGAWVYLLQPSGGSAWHIVGREQPDSEDPDSDENNDCGSRTDHGVKLTFTACRGSGAKAHGVVTGDCPGPVESVVVDDGGSGYAILGRVEPELTIAGGGGSGATFTPSLSMTDGGCGNKTWAISSVSVSGGTGYSNGAKLSVVAQDGTTVVSCAELTLVVPAEDNENEVPSAVTVDDGGSYYKEDESVAPYVAEVTVGVVGGAGGATFTANVEDNTSSGDFGTIISVDVDSGGADHVGTVNSGVTKWRGLDFSTIAGYEPTKTQMLGHGPGGCLSWFSVADCEDDPTTSGVCCISGESDGSYATQSACETAGGTWKPGASSGDLPGPCCT